MFEEYSNAVEQYSQKWQALADSSHDPAYFSVLPMTAVGWKVAGRAELLRRCDALRDLCDQIHFGWVNERWLITLHLKDLALPNNLRVIKLMERRPGSNDAIGLDHIDFYAPNAQEKLSANNELKWTKELNGDHCKWISIWFDSTEAKLRGDTVLQVCADELTDLQQQILPKKELIP